MFVWYELRLVASSLRLRCVIPWGCLMLLGDGSTSHSCLRFAPF